MLFYVKPPSGNISLQTLELSARRRLNFLIKVNQAKGDNSRLHELVLDCQNVAESECLIAGTAKDNVSHFILRLAVCTDYKMAQMFIDAETELFQFRFLCLSHEEITHFLKSIEKKYAQTEKSISIYHLHPLQSLCLLKQKFCSWADLVTRYLKGSQTDMLSVPFIYALDLVARRLVTVTRGIANVPCCKLRQILSNIFRQVLNTGVRVASELMSNDDTDRRIKRLFSTLQFLKSVPSLETDQRWLSSSIQHEDIDRESSFFPPCMSLLHQSLRRNHRLSHHARVRYTLYLKEIGLPVHEALMFWRKEYEQEAPENIQYGHHWMHDGKRYTYSIRHMYGLEGCRKNYRGHGCMSIQRRYASSPDDPGCPFTHFDKGRLDKLLKSEGIPQASVALDCSDERQCQTACQLYLKHKTNTKSNGHKELMTYGSQNGCRSCLTRSTESRSMVLMANNKCTVKITDLTNDVAGAADHNPKSECSVMKKMKKEQLDHKTRTEYRQELRCVTSSCTCSICSSDNKTCKTKNDEAVQCCFQRSHDIEDTAHCSSHWKAGSENDLASDQNKHCCEESEHRTIDYVHINLETFAHCKCLHHSYEDIESSNLAEPGSCTLCNCEKLSNAKPGGCLNNETCNSVSCVCSTNNHTGAGFRCKHSGNEANALMMNTRNLVHTVSAERDNNETMSTSEHIKKPGDYYFKYKTILQSVTHS